MVNKLTDWNPRMPDVWNTSVILCPVFVLGVLLVSGSRLSHQNNTPEESTMGIAVFFNHIWLLSSLMSVYVCGCACVWVCTCVGVHVWGHACGWACTRLGMHVCECVHVWVCMWVGVSSVLPPGGSWGSNSGSQAAWKVPLLTETSH